MPEMNQSPSRFAVQIDRIDPSPEVLATASVNLYGGVTLRNVRIKQGDYGPEAAMPKTKIPQTGEWKDVCVFPSQEIRDQFNQAVLDAYRQSLDMEEEQSLDIEEEAEDEYGMDLS